MLSSSVSDYRKNCGEYLEIAFKYPGMCLTSIEDLEVFMDGHSTAFGQLGSIITEQSFNACFNDWLSRTRDESGAAGWACSIDSMATEESIDSLALFKSLVQEFLTWWYEQPEETEALD